MDILDFTRILNLVLALISIPPSIIVFLMVLKEHPVRTGGKKIRLLLRLLFGGFSFIALVNAGINLVFYLNGNYFNLHILAQFRNVLLNTLFSIMSWGFYEIGRRKP